MPEAATARPAGAAAEAYQPPHLSDKDRVGEELADDARIWRIYDQIARADDKERIDSWNRGLDNLALFAGLFSAVTTAFIIEAQKDMKVDYTQLTFLALNASLAGKPFTQEPFVASATSRTITCLWVTSLLLSLSAALIAIMGKDWIGMYAGRPVCNARQWAEMRTYRLLCVERWYMSQVIAAAPVLLHVSLLLFGSGLVVFIPQDPITRHLTLGLALAAGALYLVTALSAVVFPASPYKSPATQMIRGAIAALLRPARDILIYRPRRNFVAKLHTAISAIVAPDLIEISRVQVRGVHMRGIWTRFLSQPELLPTSPGRAARNITNGLLDFSRSIPARLLAASTISRSALRRAYETIRETIRSFLRGGFHIRHVLLGSPWTEVQPYRSAGHIANALSWLRTASQAPEVLRALMIALGDLEMGGEVGPLVSSDLRDTIRADIRFNWRKVDFLTLSRYVLADRNLSQDAILSYRQFADRFDLEKERSLRCEDGLAAAAITFEDDHSAFDFGDEPIRKYCPDAVAQPRMASLLIPRLVHRAVRTLVIVVNSYKQLLTGSEASCTNLEYELLRILKPESRQGYRSAIQHKFGGQSGLLELLVFLIGDHVLKGAAIDAIEIIYHVLEARGGTHWCMAYLFGGRSLEWMPWTRSRGYSPMTQRIDWVLRYLPLRRYHYPNNWDNIKQPFGADHLRAIGPALARTVARTLSPTRRNKDYTESVSYLHEQLCHHDSFLTEDDKLDLIEDLLVTTPEDETETWNLGEYLHAQAVRMLRDTSTAEAMKQLLSELKDIYSFCHTSPELRAHWNRMKLPGVVDEWTFDPEAAMEVFFARSAPNMKGEQDEVESAAATSHTVERDANFWLDACMR